MGVLCVASDAPSSGKTSLAAALLTLATRSGRKVAYFRPSGPRSQVDRDTAFIEEVVLGSRTKRPDEPLAVAEPPDAAVPIDAILKQARAAAQEADRQGQALVLEVPSRAADAISPWEQGLEVAQAVGGSLIVIKRYAPLTDGTALGNQLCSLKESLAGVLVNLAPRYRLREAVAHLAQSAHSIASPFLGVLPQDRLMMAPTVAQLAAHLNARWILGEEKANSLVCRVLIGGNLMDWGPTYFGRYEDKAVVVRGDRPDIQLAALSSPSACLLLTGGHQPLPYVYHEAEEREVPLLTVDGDTFSTTQSLESLQIQATVHHEHKIHRFLQLLEQYGEVETLERSLP